LRVLHVIHDFLPRHRAGSELYAQQLALAQKRRGIDAQILCAEYEPSLAHATLRARAYRELVVHEVINNWAFGSFAETYGSPALDRVFAQVIDDTQPAVVHVHNLLNLSFGLPSLARARGVPTVATLHDHALVCPSGGQRIHLAERHVCDRIEPARCVRCFRQSPFAGQLGAHGAVPGPALGPAVLAGRALRKVFPRAMGRVDSALAARPIRGLSVEGIEARLAAARQVFAEIGLFVAPSRALGDALVQQGLPREKLEISDYGFVPRPAVTRPPRGERLRIGFVGTLAFHKGAHVLLEACRKLPGHSFELKLFGSLGVAPPYVADLQRAAQGLPVEFCGEFDETRTAETYGQLDVLVVPSLWPENSPLVIHEAFQAGVPVVGANVGGIPELVTHEKSGLVYEAWSPFALAGALRRLLEEPTLLEQLARGAPPVKTIDEDAAEWEARYARVQGTRPARGAA
jgi:glycosyltransferase involved in cell wall biosynthesis